MTDTKLSTRFRTMVAGGSPMKRTLILLSILTMSETMSAFADKEADRQAHAFQQAVMTEAGRHNPLPEAQ